jgi:intracellular septation protein
VKLLFDFFPLILFFVAYRFAGIYVATAAAIAATVVLIGWSLARRRKISPMQWVSLVVIIVFGGATLLLHDETFIKWKPTVLYWCGSAAFLGSIALGRNVLRALLAADLDLPTFVWTRLGIAWGVVFFLLGVANLYVAFNYPTSEWVNFKVFGATGIILVVAVVQTFWIARHLPDDEPAKPVAIAKANEPPQA